MWNHIPNGALGGTETVESGLTWSRARQLLKFRAPAERLVLCNIIAVLVAGSGNLLEDWEGGFVMNGPWAFLKKRRPPIGLVRSIVRLYLRKPSLFWCVDSRHPIEILRRPLKVMADGLSSDLVDRVWTKPAILRGLADVSTELRTGHPVIRRAHKVGGRLSRFRRRKVRSGRSLYEHCSKADGFLSLTEGLDDDFGRTSEPNNGRSFDLDSFQALLERYGREHVSSSNEVSPPRRNAQARYA